MTPDQKEAVRCEDHLMLTACPGSGKTRVIVSKLQRALDDVRGGSRSIACITYTNTAVYEIEARLRRDIQPGDEHYFDVCTIHSFCLNHIFRPFCHLLRGYKDGFKVITPESEEFYEHVRAIYEQHGLRDPGFNEFDHFAQIRITADGKPAGSGIERGAVTTVMARDFWKRIREAGYIDFASIIFYSLRLLQRRPEVLRYVRARFAWILVDEFQDTSDLQVEILSLIADGNQTKFFLVGDPFQSIFGFAGARPQLAEEFADHIGALREPQLSGNFRSSAHIVEHANRLFPRTPPMTAVGVERDYPQEPAWCHARTAFAAITQEFLPALDRLGIPIGDAAVLAPTWFSLFPLGRQLRDHGIAIVGPGARPYRRNRQFAPLAEQVCGYLMDARPEAITGIERALFNTLLDVTGRPNFGVFSYEGRTVVFRLLAEAKRLYERNESAITWLEAAAVAFTLVLIDAEYMSEGERDLFVMSVQEMKTDMRNNKVDLDHLTIDELGIYASPDAALKLASLHFSKGREFDAVAMIDLHEGRIPHFHARSAEEIAEAKRQFYVGVTRARKFLMYVTDDTDRRNGPSPFLRAGTGVGVC